LLVKILLLLHLLNNIYILNILINTDRYISCIHCGPGFIALKPDDLHTRPNKNRINRDDIETLHKCNECNKDNKVYWPNQKKSLK